MAIDRINPFERHVEKFVLAAAGIAFAGVVGWQFLSQPQVDLGSRKGLPSEANPELEKLANKLKSEMTATEFPNRPTPPKPITASDFATRSGGTISRSPQIAWTGPRPPSFGGGDLGPRDGKTVLVPALPAVTGVLPHAFMSTVDAAEVSASPELGGLLATQQAPFDLPAVTVAGSINGVALKNAFATTRDGHADMPAPWYEGIEIAYIEVLRQTLKPDGSWSDAESINPLPGRFSLMPGVKSQALKADELAKSAADHRREIKRPEFYTRATLGGEVVGEEWLPPSEARVRAAGGQDPNSELRGEIRRRERRLADVEAAIARLQNPGNQPGRPGGGRPGGGGGGPGGGAGGGGAGGGGAGGGGGAAPGPDAARLASLTRDRDRLERELGELRSRLTAAVGGAAATATDGALLATDNVEVWFHDVFVKRGATYRYQVRYAITNPVLGRAELIDPSNQALAGELVLLSEPSEWSEPIRVDDSVYYFITQAIDPRGSAVGGAVRPMTATAEFFTFTWGHWRRGVVTLEPGDPLVANVPVPDTTKIAAVTPAPGGPSPAGPGGGDGGGPGGGPGGGSTGGGAGGTGGGAGGGPGGAAGGQAPRGRVDLPVKDLLVDALKGYFLLDVAPIPDAAGGGGRGPQFFARLRESDGAVVIRRPTEDRARAEYERLQKSHQAGEESLRRIATGQPAPSPAGTPPTPPSPTPGGPIRP